MTLPCESYFRVTPESVSLIRLSGIGEVSLLNGILNLSQGGIFMRLLGGLLHGDFTEGTFCPAQFRELASLIHTVVSLTLAPHVFYARMAF
jgi:hypothetical protein